MNEQTQALEIVADKPQELMRRATDVAGICKSIVLNTAVQIQGRKYVKCEGWMSIATAHGCIASSRDVKRVDGGWTAVGEIKRISDGVVLSTAEGFVGKDEKRWGQADEYACRAMAQTRAISRACRAAFAHVVVLMDAGLSTTPAEEVPEGGFEDAKPAKIVHQVKTGPLNLQNVPKATQESSRPNPEACLKQLIKLLGPLCESATEYAQKCSLILPNEEFKDLPASYIPTTKEQKDDIVSKIQAFVDGGEAVKPGYYNGGDKPSGPAKSVEVRLEQSHPDAKHVIGEVQAISKREGTNAKTGNPWTKYGIKVAGGFLDTFDSAVADIASQAKDAGIEVDIAYIEEPYGNQGKTSRKILSIMPVPSTQSDDDLMP